MPLCHCSSIAPGSGCAWWFLPLSSKVLKVKHMADQNLLMALKSSLMSRNKQRLERITVIHWIQSPKNRGI